MAKVSEPTFTGLGVPCSQCPFTHEDGTYLNEKTEAQCDRQECPMNLTEYAAAVALAEEMLAGEGE